MAISHAKAHFQKRLAAQPVTAAAPISGSAANAYELMLAKLAEDKRRLKDIQSIERKADVKRQLMPEYAAWIKGVLESDSGRQDDVLMTVFVWAIDTGAFADALAIADYAIRHKLTMPDQYKRDVPTVLAEEIADYALKQDEPGLVALQPDVVRAIAITADCDMPDEVRAKLHKANGYALRSAGQLAEARDELERALQLHGKCGVKKDIERLETAIKNSSTAVDAGKPAETGAG